MLEKQRLRRQFRQQRRSLTKQQRLAKEQALNDLFVNGCLSFFSNTKQLFGYWPIDGEPHLVIDNTPYHLALPAVRQQLIFCRWQKGDPLSQGKFSKEPSPCQPVFADNNTLVLVPCIAVDRAGYRLGFGKGFYDKFLADNRQATTIGVCFSEFVVDKLPRQTHDQAVHYLLTDSCFCKTNLDDDC